ncbi:type III effector [Trinickia terrae]|uniref:Type III effector n=1 Tax=Trinickia terrae TaxID=2571161 RepID=A0A4U1HGG7_9BURK|nr:type III effector [Trinickia terrae]TKC80169.1 type III effector [Trinickia terrae]
MSSNSIGRPLSPGPAVSLDDEAPRRDEPPPGPATASPAPGPFHGLSERRTVAKRLGPGAQATLRRSQAKQSAATSTDKPSFKAGLAGTITGRQLNMTLGVPGTGRTINGPLRAGVPGQAHAGVEGPPGPLGHVIEEKAGDGDAGHDPVLEDARNLLSAAEAMAASLQQSEVAVYERPAPSMARRMATRVVPWFGPTSLQDMASFTDGHGNKLTAPAPRKDPMISRSRLANEQQARALLKVVESRRKALDDAVSHSTQARADHETARAAAPGDKPEEHESNLVRTEARMRMAEASVRAASRALHDAIHSTDLLELISLSHMSDQADKSLSFSLQRLNDLKANIYALRARAGDRRAEIELELKAHAEETEMLKSFDYDMSAAEEIALQAAARLNRMSTRYAALTGPTAVPLPAATKARLERRIARTRNTLDHALEEQERCQQRLRRFAELNDAIAELMSERARVERRRLVADRAVPSLLDASLALAQRKAHADRIDQAETGVSLAGEATSSTAREKLAIDAVRQSMVEQLVDTTPVFGPRAPPELRAALGQLALRLTAPQPPVPVPPQTVLEIVSRSMADVGADAAEAARMLDALAQHPVAHWVGLAAAQPVHGTTGAARTVDRNARVIALCRKMATLPRGTDMLHALSSGGAQPPDAARSQALRVFWNADDAQQAELSNDNGVASWLQKAKSVAHASLTPNDEVAFDDVDHAAYNAVRNGYFSNAPGSPYAQHNARLKKAITEWVIRAAAPGAASASVSALDAGDDANAVEKADDAIAPKPSLWRRAMPNLNKTPFRKRTLNRAYGVGESMGMQSPRIKVDAHVQRRMSELERTIAACREFGGTPEFRTATRTAQATIDHLKLLRNRGRHLSQIKLEPKDAKSVSRRIGEDMLKAHSDAAGRAGKPNRLRKAAPVDLPEFFEEVCGSGLTAYEAIDRIEEHLNATLPADRHRADDETTTAAGLDAAIQLMKAECLGSKTDIVAFFQSFIQNSRLRDRLRIGGGGTLGVNLPTLPYGSASPIASPIFTAETSRTDEAFVQLFMPILGMEMSFGSAHTRAKEATAGVAVGPQVAPGVSLQAAFTARAASQQTHTDSTVVRFLRSRHKDDEMRANMLSALDSMVRWDMIEPERGRRYRDPLEAMFARNPAVVVTQLEGFTDTKTVTARVAARLPSARFKDPDGVAQTLGVEVSAYAEAERTRDKRTETGGQIRIVNAKGDNAQQRAGGTVNLNFAPLTNQAVPVGPHGRHGEVQRESVPMQLGVSRDFAWVKEQHEISPFLIGDKQDADLDRHYSTPRDMLAEIAGNRENWLMRCVETLASDKNEEKDTPDNRLRAAVLLGQFERDIEKLGKTSKYCHYNVNYSMRGEAGAWIDGYRALAELAAQRGDREGAQRAQQSIDEILLMPATWRPLMLIVRERTRDSTTVGWRSLLRWQRVGNVDAQRTAAQFPPP